MLVSGNQNRFQRDPEREGASDFLNGFACTTTPRANRGEFVELRAPKDDTKFIWIFMLSKTFRNLQ
jgi:hypothetical protein